MAALPWIQWTESGTGENHPTLVDVVNRPLKALLVNSGYAINDDNPHFFSGANAVSAQAIVIDGSTVPPVTPVDGGFYLVDVGGTGVWNGHDKQIARWSTSAATYTYFTPEEGWEIYVQSDNYRYRFDGTSWVTTLAYFGLSVGSGGLSVVGGALTVNSPAAAISLTGNSVVFDTQTTALFSRIGVTQLTLGNLTAVFVGTVAAPQFLGPILDSNSNTDLLLKRNNVTRLTLGVSATTFVGNLVPSVDGTSLIGSSTFGILGLYMRGATPYIDIGATAAARTTTGINMSDSAFIYLLMSPAGTYATAVSSSGLNTLRYGGGSNDNVFLVTTAGNWQVTGASASWNPGLTDAQHIGNASRVLSVTTRTINIGTQPALTGAIKLSNGDAINWRNLANTADIAGFTIDSGNGIVVGASMSAGNASNIITGFLSGSFLGTISSTTTQQTSGAPSFNPAVLPVIPSFVATKVGTLFPSFAFARANAVVAAETPLASGDVMGHIGWYGYTNGSVWASVARATIQVLSTDNWTNAAEGTSFLLTLTQTGTITTRNVMSAWGSGDVLFGISTTNPGLGIGWLTLEGGLSSTTVLASTRVTSPLIGTTTNVNVVFDRNSVTQLTLASLVATFAGTVIVSGASISVGTTPATGGGVILIPNATGIASRNAANSANVNLLNLTAGDNLSFGSAGVTGSIQFNTSTGTIWQFMAAGHFQPVADATYNIGASALAALTTFTRNIDSGAASDLLLKRNAVTQLTLASSAATFVGSVSATSLALSDATLTTLIVGAAAGAAATDITIRSAISQDRGIRFLSNGTELWNWRISGAETGADAGAQLQFVARTDAGVNIDAPIVITRASGQPITFGGTTGRTVNFSGGLGATSTTNTKDIGAAGATFRNIYVTGLDTGAATDFLVKRNAVTQLTLASLLATFVGQVVLGATVANQLQVKYDGSNFWNINITSVGGMELLPTGTTFNLALFAAGSYGAGKGVTFIANATTVPSTNPAGGGIAYVEAGALKYRGSAGTVTTLAPA